MSGWIVGPYDLFVGGILMRGTHRAIADGLTVGVPDGGTVLDIGAGTGRLIAEIARRRPGLEVVGVEPSTDMLTRARRRTADLANARAVLAYAEDVPLDDESVDVVVSSLSSHHWADPAAALDEQARVLRPGGLLWLVDLTSHLEEGMADRIAAAGLRITDDDPGWSVGAARRLTLISARKPLAAA